MRAKTPKEDPADKAARERERRIADAERQDTTENQAAGLTSDLRAVYGLKGYRGASIFRTAAAVSGAGSRPTTQFGTQAIVGNPNSFSNQALARRTLPSFMRPLGAQNGQSR
jgi:hypothetical protein